MAGRKPLTTGHVDDLDGSERARDRLRTFLETLSGTLPIPTACARLGLGESYFHELRREWLQGSLTLLEPKPLGRPRRDVDAGPLGQENARLTREAAALREQVRATQVQAEIERVLTPSVAVASGKKSRQRARSTRMKPR
jgi:hypothetical protein